MKPCNMGLGMKACNMGLEMKPCNMGLEMKPCNMGLGMRVCEYFNLHFYRFRWPTHHNSKEKRPTDPFKT